MESTDIEFDAKDFDHHDGSLLGERTDVVYEALRRAGVARSERHGGFWVISRYEDAYRAAQDWRTFSSGKGMTLPRISFETMPFVPIDTDPPAHSRYRKLLLPFFSPPAVAKMEPAVREYVIKRIDSFIEQGECDLVKELAEPVPMFVFFELLGIPESDRRQLAEWVHMMAHPGEDEDVGLEGATEVLVYMAALMNERRERLGNDLISSLLQLEVDGSRLDDDEILSFLFLLPGAGYDTTASALGDFFLHFAENRDQWAELRANSELVPSAIEELLRHQSPVQATARYVTSACAIGGQELEAGDTALIVFGAANLDEREFPEAEHCMLARDPNRHLAFGSGVHRCLGSNLARMELRVVLEEMLKRIDDFSIRQASAPVEHSVGHIRGVTALPVAFQRAPTSGGVNAQDVE